MKILLTIALVFLFQIANAQLDMQAALRQSLTGKTKFEDIKTTINQFYNQKLASNAATDTNTSKAIMRQLKKWNRQFWLSEYYTNGDGIVQDKNKIDADAFNKIQNTTSTNTSSSGRQVLNWVNHGPFNSNKGIGRIDKIAFHPTNPNVMYVGSPHGGLFYSIDGGNSWVPRSSNLPSLGIAGIAIDPNNPDIIYVLTGDANTNGGCFPGNACLILGEQVSASQGVFKSINGGSSWQKTGSLATGIYTGSEIAMDPTNSNILLAATSVGLFRTTNGGATWQQTESGNVFDVKYKPDDGSIVYITSSFSASRSINGGVTFDLINFPTTFLAGRRAIAVTPANPNRVIVYGGRVDTYINTGTIYTGGVFSSNNAGQSFTPKNTTTDLFSRTDGSVGATGTGGQYSYNICIAISPTNENIIYTGGLCVWASTDTGATWTRKSDYWDTDPNYMHPDIHALKFNPLNGSLYCGNDGGVYKQNGTTWDTKYNGLSATQFYHFESEKNSNLAWGGTQDNGIMKQIAASGQYSLDIFGDGYDVLTDHNYLVNDGGSTNHYSTVNTGVFKNGIDYGIANNLQFFGNLAMSPISKDKIYVGYQTSVYKKITAASAWQIAGGSGNWCISSCRNNDSIVYAAGTGIAGQRLFKLNIFNNTTTNITPLAPYDMDLKITDIDVDPNNSNILWISIGGTQANAKIFYSDNAGATWQNYTFNLPNIPIFCIKKDANYGLYVGTSIGVFYSKDVNPYWEPYSTGLPPSPVSEIELWPEPNPVNGNVPSYAPSANPEIWISTFGRGIWYTQQSTAVCESAVTLSTPVSGVYYKEVSNTINSSQSLIGGEGTNVKYNASQSILLTNGFFAPEGTRFQTFTTGCGNPIDLNKTNTVPSPTPPVKPKEVNQ